MKAMKKIFCLVLAMAMLLVTLVACDAGDTYDPTPEVVRPPAVTPNANGEITFGDQTFSVDTEQLSVNLQVRSNELLDLSALAWCTRLRSLTVNVIVTPHIYFDKFNDPHVMEMTPTDLTPLAGLQYLEHLELNVNKIVDLQPLAQLKQLSSLVLWIEGNVDLSPLASCESLTGLLLGGRGTVDLTPLSKCRALTNLRVDVYDSEWNSPDLSALSGMPALETLSIGASRGLSQLTDVPLKNILDLNDSGDILENLPDLATLEYVEFSDEHLDDITPLLLHPSVAEIKLEVGAQDLENFTVIQSANDSVLDQLITPIPVTQLREFLMRNGTSITIVVDKNRIADITR